MEPSDVAWQQAIDEVVADPSRLRAVVQPIVDLRRGVVVGHELLSRFEGPPDATPDRWFAAAERLGRGAELAALSVRRGMDLLDELPSNTFLTINLEPPHIDAPPVLAAFARGERLDRVILELTEHTAVDRPQELLDRLAPLRERGARLALDDAGAGYAGLALLLALRPDLVKLDRGLIMGLDTDPVKRVLVRALGELAGSTDAWVLAEGIETLEELDELVTLQVPLGQGYLLGRPAPGFAAEIPIDAVQTIQTRVQRQELPHLMVTLLQQVPQVTAAEPPSADTLRLATDELGRPVALDRGDGTRTRSLLLAKPSEQVHAVAARAAAREAYTAADPVVLTDGRGVAVGIATVPRLLEHLAARVQAGG